MKKISKFFGVISSFALLIGGIAMVAKQNNKQYVEASASNAQSDIDEFTNNGQFSYAAGTGTTLTVLSSTEAAAVAAGNEGAILRINGQNTVVTLDFSGSYIIASDIVSIDFRLYTADSSSSLTQADFRIRKDGAGAVVNENSAGFGLLPARNEWVSYSLTGDKFVSNTSFNTFADENGFLKSFQLFFRTSAWINVYLDYVRVTTRPDYGLATLSDVNSNFVSPTQYTAATTSIPVNNMSPFGAHSIGLKFGVNAPNGTGIVIDFSACSNFADPHYTIRLGTNSATDGYVTLLHNNKEVETKYGITFAKDVTHTVEFYSIVLDAETLRHEVVIDGITRYAKNTTYDEGDIGRVEVLTHYQNTTDPVTYTDVDVVNTALNRFGVNKLDSKTVSFDDNRETGACLSKYAAAKTFFNTYVTSSQRVAFATNANYANLKARMMAWAAANGEVINFDANTGALTASSNNTLFFKEQSNQLIIISIVISTLLVVGLISARIIKKRKEE